MKTTPARVFLCCLVLTVASALLLSGCASANPMPFNGDVTFHSISLHVDDRFIRDSTQSTDDLWIFERGGYQEYVILSRKDAAENAENYLPIYAESMEDVGAETEIQEFLGSDAVFSTYTKDGVYCQEVLFPHNGSYYAIALRCGTEEGFAELIDTVSLIEASNTNKL